jgi:aryl-alcohol dehydrogenase-like predicted oxidoreductase
LNPRFTGENFAINFGIVERVREIAKRLEVTAGQVALAWVLAQSEGIVSIPGTKRVAYLEENAAASDVVLSQEDLASLAEFTPVGNRYPDAFMEFSAR